MEYRSLGRTGVKVSSICLGAMMFGGKTAPDDAYAIIDQAIDQGINFIDTANVYGRGAAETFLGEALKGRPRDSYVLATKLYFPMSATDRGLSRAQIEKQLDASLRRLGTDHVDVYYVHRFDPETPVEETMAALDTLVQAGKVRYLGASSMWAWQFAKMQHVAALNGWTPFAAMHGAAGR